MSEAIGAVLAFAVGVGVSPIPIIAVILMLFSRRARVNGPLFLIGWMVGLSVVVTGMELFAGAIGLSDDSDGNVGVSWVRLGLGVLLVAAAVRKWQKRPGPDEEPPLPRWMTTLDQASPRRALVLAMALSANPKNILMAAGAVSSLAVLDVTAAQTVAALAVFVLLSSSFVIAAVAYDVVGGQRARARLVDAKGWLTANNSTVMTVLFLVFGAVLIGQGLASGS
jgi:hypothetical protein